LEEIMKAIIAFSAIIAALATITPADAKGCIKGAIVGGVAGHYAAHHGLIGAAAGCVIGHHEAKERAKMERERSEHPTDEQDVHSNDPQRSNKQ
jgi:outer membrane lipoprotein SlyB